MNAVEHLEFHALILRETELLLGIVASCLGPDICVTSLRQQRYLGHTWEQHPLPRWSGIGMAFSVPCVVLLDVGGLSESVQSMWCSSVQIRVDTAKMGVMGLQPDSHHGLLEMDPGITHGITSPECPWDYIIAITSLGYTGDHMI